MLEHDFLVDSWMIDILDQNNKFKIPKDTTRVKIDVGLAGDACNSAIWLADDLNCTVIAIEPQEFCWEHIFQLGSNGYSYKDRGKSTCIDHPNWKIVQLKDNIVTQNNEKVCSIGNRLLKIRTAIDDSKKPHYEKMYNNNVNAGASSLVFVDNGEFSQEDYQEVPVSSLEFILDHFPWDRFSYIDHLKTDCERLDEQAIMGLGKYLNRIVYISVEISHNYEFLSWMESNEFNRITNNKFGNVDFVNNKYLDVISENNIKNLTLGH